MLDDETGHYYGARFGDHEFKDLARRTGFELSAFHAAMHNLREYRLVSGLLQRSIYTRSSGGYEYLTVVPRGNWRTTEVGGRLRRLTLRRYLIVLFHNTPAGVHMGRDRTVQALLDAGMWWPQLYNEVQDVVRACLICKSEKGQQLITGHQRSRD